MTQPAKLVEPSLLLTDGCHYTPSWLMPIPDKELRLIPRLGGRYGLLAPKVPEGTQSLADEDVNPSTSA